MPGIKTRINNKIPNAKNHLSNWPQKLKGSRKIVIKKKGLEKDEIIVYSKYVWGSHI